MSNKVAATLIIVSALTFGGSVVYLMSTIKNKTPGVSMSASRDNVSIVDGKQVIEINAKGGYSPRITAARADLPNVLKIKTNNTFDCSSAVVIPDLNFRENLKPSGERLVEIPAQKKGSIIRGTCAMGMYHFSLNFN